MEITEQVAKAQVEAILIHNNCAVICISKIKVIEGGGCWNYAVSIKFRNR